MAYCQDEGKRSSRYTVDGSADAAVAKQMPSRVSQPKFKELLKAALTPCTSSKHGPKDRGLAHEPHVSVRLQTTASDLFACLAPPPAVQEGEPDRHLLYMSCQEPLQRQAGRQVLGGGMQLSMCICSDRLLSASRDIKACRFQSRHSWKVMSKGTVQELQKGATRRLLEHRVLDPRGCLD